MALKRLSREDDILLRKFDIEFEQQLFQVKKEKNVLAKKFLFLLVVIFLIGF